MKIRNLAFALGACAAALVPAVSTAADLPAAISASPWQVRVRAIGVLPDTSNPSLFAGGGLVPNAKIGVTDQYTPEVDITYYFTPNIAAELIAATLQHRAYGQNAIAGLGKLGSAWVLPPTLTLQYHFTDFGAFKPYVGAGVNYTFFYGEKDAALSGFNLKGGAGWDLQAGVDYMLDQHWGINFDVKKLFLRTTATGNVGAIPVSSKLKLDPWIIGTGITYRF